MKKTFLTLGLVSALSIASVTAFAAPAAPGAPAAPATPAVTSGTTNLTADAGFKGNIITFNAIVGSGGNLVYLGSLGPNNFNQGVQTPNQLLGNSYPVQAVIMQAGAAGVAKTWVTNMPIVFGATSGVSLPIDYSGWSPSK